MTDTLDPRGLIRDSYRMDGIGTRECRTIFLDWALGLPDGTDEPALVRALLERHAAEAARHPMTQVLTEALDPAPPHGRRGGRAARLSRN